MKDATKNFLTVLSNPRFMLFLLIFSGYWVVYWQEFIILPLYIHDYINPKTDTELMLVTGPLTVIALQMVVSFLTQKIPAFTAIILGTLISGLAWFLLILHPSVPMAIATLIVISLGEITQSPRYYEYISRLAPPGQQGTYMGFAFMPIGIGSLIGGWFGEADSPLRRGYSQPEPNLVGSHRRWGGYDCIALGVRQNFAAPGTRTNLVHLFLGATDIGWINGRCLHGFARRKIDGRRPSDQSDVRQCGEIACEFSRSTAFSAH